MSEQVRSVNSRPYQMRRRAELVDQTRERITEAAVRLHTTIGPGSTSISNVAEEAGVSRLTVYRHFPNLEHLFDACRRHWIGLHPPPNPTAWLAIPDLEARAWLGLGELYAWFGENANDLFPINRDAMAMPKETQLARAQESAALAAALVEGHVPGGRAGVVLRALAGHVTSYWTWRSLVVEQGLREHEAVEVAVRLLCATAPRLPGQGRITRSRPVGSANTASEPVTD